MRLQVKVYCYFTENEWLSCLFTVQMNEFICNGISSVPIAF